MRQIFSWQAWESKKKYWNFNNYNQFTSSKLFNWWSRCCLLFISHKPFFNETFLRQKHSSVIELNYITFYKLIWIITSSSFTSFVASYLYTFVLSKFIGWEKYGCVSMRIVTQRKLALHYLQHFFYQSVVFLHMPFPLFDG